MRKLSFLTTIAALASLLVPQAFAASGTSACPSGIYSVLCFSSNQLGPIIGSVVTLFFVLVGLVALWFLVMGGFKWLMSEGDKTNLEAARNQIMAAVVGLIIVFVSYLLVNLILGFATGGKVSLTNIIIPSLPAGTGQ